jgi:membrane protein required for colicin V production
MSLFDLGILVLLFVSAMLGYRSGLIQAFFSLAGLFAGIAMAARSYQQASNELMPYLHDQTFADGLGFCLVLGVVMLIAGLIGWALKKMVSGIGLETLDKILGLIFGILRGGLLVSLCIVMLAIFLPGSQWTTDAQLPRYFRSGIDLTVNLWPDNLQEQVNNGIHTVKKETTELKKETTKLEKETKQILKKDTKQIAHPK